MADELTGGLVLVELLGSPRTLLTTALKVSLTVFPLLVAGDEAGAVWELSEVSVLAGEEVCAVERAVAGTLFGAD